MRKLFSLEPYAIFFPFGTIFFMWGVGLWVAFAFSEMSVYPKEMHSLVMTRGFLFSFVNGFLMTAIPRFTETINSTILEKVTTLVLCLFMIIFIILNKVLLINIISIFIFINLAVFAAKRFLKRKKDPPPSFIFIGVGVFVVLLGLVFQIVVNFGYASLFIDELSRKFLNEGFIIFMILGVGSRLVPALFGHSTMPDSESDIVAKVGNVEFLMMILLSIILLLTYILESIGFISISYFVRFFVVSVILIWKWKLPKFPLKKSSLTWGIYMSGISLIMGYLLVALDPANISYYLHLVYIGGIALITYMIATRVFLSHLNMDSSFERKKILVFVSSLIILATITRVSLFILPNLFKTHLGYSGIVLLIAVFTWVVSLIIHYWKQKLNNLQ